MKISNKVLLVVSLLCSYSAVASDWLQGVYINNDKNSGMDEVIFCDAGKAYAGMAHRQYTIETKDGQQIVELSSNGKFHFIVTDNGEKLLPADSFTKDWFTSSSLTKDTTRTDTCNW